jgi:hypothetical protein
MSTINTERNAILYNLARNGKKREHFTVHVKSQNNSTGNADHDEAAKRGRVRRETAIVGVGDQITKLFAKAAATAVAREDRNAIAGQLQTAKAAVSTTFDLCFRGR